MKNMAKMNDAQKNNDTVVINSLRKEYKALQKEMTDYMFSYPEKNPKSYISLLITQSMVGNPEFTDVKTEKIFNSLDKELKESIKKDYRYVCQMCNAPKVKLDVHHIDYNKKNNANNNLIPLCKHCHAKTNFKREEWETLFKNRLNKN